MCVQGKLMTSWAVVCDVYFLEPQKQGGGESAQQFAERVQRLIAERAKLQVAPWDGYLKYYTLGVKVPPPSARLPICPTLPISMFLGRSSPRSHALTSGYVTLVLR